MAKSRANITIDPYTHEKAKDVYENFSQRVEELIEADLDVSQVQDEELLKDEIEKKENKLQEIEEELEDLRESKEQLEAELNTAKATLQRKERKEQEEDDELDRFREVFKEKTSAVDSAEYTGSGDTWSEPSDIPEYWSRELDMSKEELWEEVDGSAA